MPIITFPDGRQRQFAQPVTLTDIATSISPSLAKNTVAGKVNDRLVDSSYLINEDASISLITTDTSEGLDVIRHSAAHLLAHAVKQLYPEAQVTIGPVIEDGFFYDFYYPQGFTSEDLPKIEAQMELLVKQHYTVSNRKVERSEAIDFFKNIGEDYKVQVIEGIPSTESLTLYTQDNFTDLCRGPHVPHSGFLKAFKLTKVAGAYWRGDQKNEMLQRIYGTAWADKKALAEYLHQLEEAEKRDHRKLGKKLDLFHTQEEAPGMVFWHPKGWAIYQVIEQYLRTRLAEWEYQEVRTPQLLDRGLWEKSGHWEKFGDDMFYSASESRQYAVKPMSCPCHVEIFKQGLRSYRDLPLRLAEFGSCHRNEPSGSLHGLMRVRGFTQDDGHIFCTEQQIATEAAQVIQEIKTVYADFGFDNIQVKLSTRPEKRMGSDEVWDKAEAALQEVLEKSGLEWALQPGEGAFYGPKIEFSLKDCLKRVWQCGTLQVDFFIPDALGSYYIAEDNSKKVPVMLHRALLGSFERFIGILLEDSAGHLPVWLAPIQVVVLSITDAHHAYATEVYKTLKNNGVRASVDLRNEKIGFKIREHTMQYIPYLLVIGDQEQQSGTLAVRTQSGENLGTLSVEAFIQKMQNEVAKRCKKG